MFQTFTMAEYNRAEVHNKPRKLAETRQRRIHHTSNTWPSGLATVAGDGEEDEEEEEEDDLLHTPTIVIENVADYEFVAGDSLSSEGYKSQSSTDSHVLASHNYRQRSSYRKAVSNARVSAPPPPVSVALWTEDESPHKHLFQDHSSSSDPCAFSISIIKNYHIFHGCEANWSDCPVTQITCDPNQRAGGKKRCSVCGLIFHEACIQKYKEIMFPCRPSFCEEGSETHVVRHHFLYQKKPEGKCGHCKKTAKARGLIGRDGATFAVTCTWCHVTWHFNTTCFPPDRLSEPCSLGKLAYVTVPPTIITRNVLREPMFCVQAGQIASDLRPVLVFCNPKSGGKKGRSVILSLQRLINPRQVFDLSKPGALPLGLSIFHKVPGLCILVCGGDGTVGWVLSELDQLHLPVGSEPPVAVLPLGTGNDLSRVLNWGGGYGNEPLSSVLVHVAKGRVVGLDRWYISVAANQLALQEQLEADKPRKKIEKYRGGENLPLTVMNNYFSIGADAYVAYKFHSDREANPNAYSSAFMNKFKYFKYGGANHLKQHYRNLYEFVELECDGINYTEMLRQKKFHCLLFCNIASYAAGSDPWGMAGTDAASNPGPDHFLFPRCDDGMLEVIALYTRDLAMLHFPRTINSPGVRLCQAKSVRLVTTSHCHMQVDGEPCVLQPSIINIRIKGRSRMIQRSHLGSASGKTRTISVLLVSYSQYLQCTNSLQQIARHYGEFDLVSSSYLWDLRVLINDRLQATENSEADSMDRYPEGHWNFIEFFKKGYCWVPERSEAHIPFSKLTTSDRIYVVDQVERRQGSLDHLDLPHEGLRLFGGDQRRRDNEGGKTYVWRTTSLPDVGADWQTEINHNQVYNGVCLEAGRRAGRGHVIATPDVVVHPPSEESGRLMVLENGSGETSRLAYFKLQQLGVTAVEPYQVYEDIMSGRFVQCFPHVQATPDTPTSETAALFHAVKEGDMKQLTDLLDQSHDLQDTDNNGVTILHAAIIYGFCDMTKLILQKKPRLANQPENICGLTPLHFSVLCSRPTSCAALVSAGAKVTTLNIYKHSVRQMAEFTGKGEKFGPYLRVAEETERKKHEQDLLGSCDSASLV